jgi:hypothetical protein
VLERAVTDQYGVAERALPKKMGFVFARGEIDRGKILRRDLAIDGHRKRHRDEWSPAGTRLILPAR